MTAVALVVAAGRGTRLGGEIPKQYQDLGGRPILAHALEAFINHPKVSGVRVVIHPDDNHHYLRAATGLELPAPVIGGETRQDSVCRGLEALASDPPNAVLIHDAARPFISAKTITASLDALTSTPGAIAAIPVSDTLKRAQKFRIQETLDRTSLWQAQTPQSFLFADILSAHRAAAGLSLTDDAAVAERAGLAVTIIAGSQDNVKITTAEDLARARRSIESQSGTIRVGSGFDAHRFGPGDHVVLCGISIPHSHGLAGHSDADPALHALTDAVLSTLSEGDIGVHFPSTDARWKDSDSSKFLEFATRRVKERNGKIIHLTITIICETPKIGSHRHAMRSHIAKLAGITLDQISVQATTTDGLGFTGRGDGIAAQATATIQLPFEPEVG